MGLVVCCQVVVQWANSEIKEAYLPDKPPAYFRYIPAVVNALLIETFKKIYGKVSKILVKGENHRYHASYENSMINKTYMFAFVNTYIGNYVAILYAQSFAALTINLAITMLFKQVIVNVIEYV